MIMNSVDEEEDCESLPLEEDDQMEVTLENIRTVIENNGGKIANKALVKQFKKALSSSKENRTKFQAIINELAVVEKDSKGRDVISLKKKSVPVDENKQPEEPERPKDLPSIPDDAPSTSKDEEDGKTPNSTQSPESPVAEVKSPFDSAESPTGEKVRERAKMFEIGDKSSQERDIPSRILRSATDEKAIVCASGHAEEDNAIAIYAFPSQATLDMRSKYHKLSAMFLPDLNPQPDNPNASPPKFCPTESSEEEAVSQVTAQVTSQNVLQEDIPKAPKATKRIQHQLDDVKRKWMIMAARCDYQGMARLLQDHNHLAGWKNFVNGTALHFAAKAGQEDCIKMLAGKYKAKVDVINHAGMTPLHLAAMHNRGPSIQVLVEVYKADPNIRDYSGKLPKDYLKDTQTRRMSLQRAYDDSLNMQMLLEPLEQISNATIRYFRGIDATVAGTTRFDTSTIEGASGGTLKGLDSFASSHLLRRSFRVGSTRPPTSTLMADQRYVETLMADQKGFYSSSMKRGHMSPVSRAMSMPKSRATSKKHIKNQKKFTSMIEEIAEENDG